MKNIIWLGNTLQIIKSYPDNVKQEIGYNLDKIQKGKDPHDWKSMPTIAPGVKEIRIHEVNEYRVLYVAKFEEAIYVLNVFVKKAEKTLNRELLLAKTRYAEMLAIRKK